MKTRVSLKYFMTDWRFDGVYSRVNLPKEIKDRAYVINVDEYGDVGTHMSCFVL